MKHLTFQCVAMVAAVPFHGFISVYLAATFLFLTGLSLFSLFSLIMLAHEMTEPRRFDDHVRLMTKRGGLGKVREAEVQASIQPRLLKYIGLSFKKRKGMEDDRRQST